MKSADTMGMGSTLPHESAHLHVQGAAPYADDLPEARGTLYAALVLSAKPHARIKSMNLDVVRAAEGVVDVFSAADLPAAKKIGAIIEDEPIFPSDIVEYVGQPLAVVVATSVRAARIAARLAKIEYEELPALLTIQDALDAKAYVLDPVRVARGDADAGIAAAPRRLQGEMMVGGQEQFYLEGQIAIATPCEDGRMQIVSSTQHPGEVQHWVALALGCASAQVDVSCRRMGGGFGGKETQAGWFAVFAALAARRTGKPVKLRVDRDDDFEITGKRHDFLIRYDAGFDDEGRILGLKMMLASRCGYSADLSGPVNDRAVFHCDNVYYLADFSVESYRCKTHTQSNTAFRGFGGPQGMIAIETVIEDIARALDRDPLDVRRLNYYGKTDRNVTHYGMTIVDNIIPELMDRLAATSDYAARRGAIRAWNETSPVLKRGIAMTPVKFGISFTATHLNQAGALVRVYGDGSVQVTHGGTEMGQGLHTKVLQIVATELGVPFAQVRITASDTGRIPNASATAASAGTDLNGRAAQFAARRIRDRLAACAAGLFGCDASEVHFENGMVSAAAHRRMPFAQLVEHAFFARIQLWSDGFYATPDIHYDRNTLTGTPFYYFAYGAAVSEVAIDTLTGENRVLRVDILHDVGRSINPAIDIGQIEGGFVQGMGWLTTEELVWHPSGKLWTHAPSTYKIPVAADVPADLRIALWHEENRLDNVGVSKAVGEPPLMLAISVYEAMRDAVASVARPGECVVLEAPATPQEVLMAVQRLPD